MEHPEDVKHASAAKKEDKYIVQILRMIIVEKSSSMKFTDF